MRILKWLAGGVAGLLLLLVGTTLVARLGDGPTEPPWRKATSRSR